MTVRSKPPDRAETLSPGIPSLKQYGRTVSVFRALGARTAREKEFLLTEMAHIRGLMPLLMKQRNRGRWTPEDKAELATQLKRLSRLSPYLAVIVLPGGFFLLPAVAWWLDRRRNRNAPPPRSDVR